MEPAKAITEIKVLQTGGASAGQLSASQPVGMMSPILKTILEAGAAYPLLRELMRFAEVDGSKLSDKAKGALAQLGGQIETAMKDTKELPPANAAE
jgi:hypothetical protein